MITIVNESEGVEHTTTQDPAFSRRIMDQRTAAGAHRCRYCGSSRVRCGIADSYETVQETTMATMYEFAERLTYCCADPQMFCSRVWLPHGGSRYCIQLFPRVASYVASYGPVSVPTFTFLSNALRLCDFADGIRYDNKADELHLLGVFSGVDVHVIVGPPPDDDDSHVWIGAASGRLIDLK